MLKRKTEQIKAVTGEKEAGQETPQRDGLTQIGSETKEQKSVRQAKQELLEVLRIGDVDQATLQ
jgi:hypothetical protein